MDAVSLPRTSDVVAALVSDLEDHRAALLAAHRLLREAPTDEHLAGVDKLRVRCALLNRAIADAGGPIPELPDSEGDA